MIRQKSPARAGAACGGRISRQSAAASVDSMELSCTAKGVTRGRPPPAGGEARADIVLAAIIGGEIDARAPPARPGRATACRAGPRSSGGRNRRPQTSAETGLPGRPRTRTGAAPIGEPAEHQRLARPHGDPPEIEAHPGGFQRRPGEVVLADRGAAERDDDVGGQVLRRAGSPPRSRAASSWTMPRSIAVAAEGSRRGRRRRARSRRRSGRGPVRPGRHQLVAGGDHRDHAAGGGPEGRHGPWRRRATTARKSSCVPARAGRRRRRNRARRGGCAGPAATPSRTRIAASPRLGVLLDQDRRRRPPEPARR